ncbi:hypothetical protein B0H19DRAFT_1255793 [Mycena capillaripes]|nr:hypothetical protein B0H19DRAFT_1255793 [Mycena capillaripes]
MSRFDGLSWDDRTNFWGWKTDESSWGNASFSSQGSSTEGSSSTETVSSQSSSTLNHPQMIRKRPPPPYRQICRAWLRDRCNFGCNCKFVHGDLDLNFPDIPPAAPNPHPPPENPSRNNVSSMSRHDGLSWDERTNFWGYKTDENSWGNTSLSSEDSSIGGSSSPETVSSQSSSTPNHPQMIRKRPPPPYRETCRDWLRDRCKFGYNCKFVHGDLDLNLPDIPSAAPKPPPPPPEPLLSVTIHDHTQVKIGSGFEIHDVTTSVEIPWIILSNVPARVTLPVLQKLLSPFGSVLDLKLPLTPAKDVMTVRARFASHGEALQASTALDGCMFFKARISARVPVNSRSGMASIHDSSVRIQWEAPQKVAYGGYPSLQRAQEAISAAKKGPSDDYHVHASIHVGLPAIGTVTVRFSNLPPSADEKFMERFGRPDDIMWERPNYTTLSLAVDGIKRILQGLGNFLELDVLPPPYSHGLIRAWATFTSSAAARTAANALHGRKPTFTGKTRIFASHVQTLAYHMPFDEYQKDARLIDSLREAVFRNGNMTIATRRQPTEMLIRLSAEGVKPLGWLKAEFEKISRGEILRDDGVVVWDFFFARPDGSHYLRSVEAEEPGVRIETDKIRRTLKVFGTPPGRAAVRKMLLQKMSQLKSQRVRVIRVPGRVVSAFLMTQLTRLCDKFGAENIFVDIWERTITLRGGDELYEAGLEAVHQAQQSPIAQLNRRLNVVECPVCFNEIVSPITLRCGHRWCRACLVQYLLAAIDNRHFPLRCLADEAKCTECIPLSTARSILQPNEFNSVIEASVSSYVHSHAKQLHYCPSPDCLQVYRTGPKGTVVQCPSCLLRICSHCHAEAHDGFACVEQDGGDRLFKEWAASHDVKNCPGCAIPIERDEGCHHVTCIQCQTHICWVCLQTFPKGEGIYKHMREEHGGIGLGEDA